jgi:hypothetical protein
MKQEEFAYRIRQALNEGADQIDEKTQVRLEAARKTALARRKAREEPDYVVVGQFATVGGAAPLDGGESGIWAWIRGAGLVAPVFALIAGFVGIYQWQHARIITELADIDMSVLLDDAPLEAYADKGFGEFLQSEVGKLTVPPPGSDAEAADAGHE